MLAVSAHHRSRENAPTRQKPAHHRYLEDQGDTQRQRQEGANVRLYGDEILQFSTHLIGSQEAESQRKNDEIAEQQTHDKHQRTAQHSLIEESPFVGIKGGNHEKQDLPNGKRH